VLAVREAALDTTRPARREQLSAKSCP
jgi:hypothetical protein